MHNYAMQPISKASNSTEKYTTHRMNARACKL